MKVIFDVWGGEDNMDHVARFILPMSDALTRAQAELEAGFLVNLRCDCAWGQEENFDDRLKN